MLILEIAAGVVLGGIALALLKVAVEYPAYSRTRHNQEMALIIAEHKRLWDEEYEKLILPSMRPATRTYYFADDKSFREYVSERQTNRDTRAYYIHPDVRTPEEAAFVEASPSPDLFLDAEAVRTAMKLRGAASLAVIAGGVRA